ncbi:DNA-directed RNA polymerase subunit beta [Anaerolineales bacterium HSG6]|nr:DNA-directed RNA polymerase subunit beta [Anaerolineales bacterium HSG6]MDM8531192.1 DNA-directed RNA polymerase subunit beta [Anaerolineales bacterium HSG25]
MSDSPLRKKSYARTPDIIELPRLIEVQLQSFKDFRKERLGELFSEISPIISFNKNLELHFLDYRFDESKYTEDECRERDITYSSPLWINIRLVNKETGEIQDQEVFMGDFPLMTKNATFVINGAERVVVSQLIRSPGAYFTSEEDRVTGRNMSFAKLIPNRGAWLEFETSRRDLISVKVDRKRKLPVTVLLRAIQIAELDDEQLRLVMKDPSYSIEHGLGSDEQILTMFEDVDNQPEHAYIPSTIDRDPTKNTHEALLEFYKRLRPGDPPTIDNAVSFLTSLLFSGRRYDLGKVGRYKLDRRLEREIPVEERILTIDDLKKVVSRMIQINNGERKPDDIDHLGNRRVKTVGELIQNQLRIGLLRMERVVRERMSIRDPESMSPMSLVNIRPVVAATREFFGGSQLSQFMDQTNPLAELTHKRTISALGPGGLRRERAGFDVRDVHHSHYGRICPIETPEGPNIGLIGRLAAFSRVNEYGFIETPYRRVMSRIRSNDVDRLVGKTVRITIKDPNSDEDVAPVGTLIDEDLAIKIANLNIEGQVHVRAQVTEEITYLSADDEDRYTIAQANAGLDEEKHFLDERISVRHHQTFDLVTPEKVDFMDVSPKQIVGISAALIPFLEHDDANRALMGSNMQRQAVPLIRPESPAVGTGMETQAAVDSGQVIVAVNTGEVVSTTGLMVTVREEDGTYHDYPLRKFNRSNQSTCIDQRPIVHKGQWVKKGQVLADSSSTQQGELALGQNVLCAFLSWEGGNYEDAILISEELVRRDKFTSIHIEKHEIEARDTKLGPEEITRDIPNVGEDALKDLDERGVIRVGAEVGQGDILVGKITPKGETELTPEEKLLRAIFGEKAREVKDSSLRLPPGDKGIVVDVKEFSREEHRDLPTGVDRMVRVMIAQRRKLTEGDKMAGRHGNKGVISKVVPIEDMPFLEDGTPVQIILNPLGVPARMNIGQILETHLGWAGYRLGFKAITAVFDGAEEDEIAAELSRAWLIDNAWIEITDRAWKWVAKQGLEAEYLRNEDEARAIYMLNHFDSEEYDDDLLGSDYTYTRRVVLREWLKERDYDPDFLLAFEGQRRPRKVGLESREAVRLVCLREWLKAMQGHVDNAMDGRVSATLDKTDIEALTDEELDPCAFKVSRELVLPLPTTGKVTLFNGKTGTPFDKPVTVGMITMLKLAHLVEDKVHARSTGPYSLVTQQPLGGKAQFGGQRFGEMEVWALEAYGAAHTLQEMLTVKSDDVIGRVKTYEAIVKGEPIQDPGLPESFRVLVKELQSLGLSVEVISESDERMTFGKEEQKERLPKLGLGLGIPGGAR